MPYLLYKTVYETVSLSIYIFQLQLHEREKNRRKMQLFRCNSNMLPIHLQFNWGTGTVYARLFLLANKLQEM